jgi:hypothetical protein
MGMRRSASASSSCAWMCRGSRGEL